MDEEFDWRADTVGKLVSDMPAAFPGGPSHKAGEIMYFNLIFVKHPEHNYISFATASPTSMALNIAIEAAAKAKRLRKTLALVNAPSPQGTVKMVANENLPHLFDFFEQCMIAVTFSFQALETFSNRMISEKVKGVFHLQRDKRVLKLTPTELERKASTEEKLSVILPKILSLQSPKSVKIWDNFVRLKRIRDATIHLKRREIKEGDQDSIFFQFFNSDAKEFPKYALEIIEYFTPGKSDWIEHVRKLLDNR
jgi:hypothetical protein